MIIRNVKNTIKIVMGVILVIVGLIGGLIPIFQGWIFGIPGLLLFVFVSWAEKWKLEIGGKNGNFRQNRKLEQKEKLKPKN